MFSDSSIANGESSSTRITSGISNTTVASQNPNSAGTCWYGRAGGRVSISEPGAEQGTDEGKGLGQHLMLSRCCRGAKDAQFQTGFPTTPDTAVWVQEPAEWGTISPRGSLQKAQSPVGQAMGWVLLR